MIVAGVERVGPWDIYSVIIEERLGIISSSTVKYRTATFLLNNAELHITGGEMLYPSSPQFLRACVRFPLEAN